MGSNYRDSLVKALTTVRQELSEAKLKFSGEGTATDIRKQVDKLKKLYTLQSELEDLLSIA